MDLSNQKLSSTLSPPDVMNVLETWKQTSVVRPMLWYRQINTQLLITARLLLKNISGTIITYQFLCFEEFFENKLKKTFNYFICTRKKLYFLNNFDQLTHQLYFRGRRTGIRLLKIQTGGTQMAAVLFLLLTEFQIQDV